MIRLELSQDALSRVRFMYSPMWELSQSIRVLVHDRGSRRHARWLRAAERQIRPESIRLLSGLMPNPFWFPDFLSPPPGRRPRSVEHELRALATMTSADIAAEIATTNAGPLPVETERLLGFATSGEELAGMLHKYWLTVVKPHWPKILRLHRADLDYRADALAAHGLRDSLNALHTRIRFERQRLVVDMPRHDVTRSDTIDGVTFVPCAFGWPDVLVVVAERYPVSISYPPRGVGELWHEEAAPADAAVAALLGRSRAGILELLSRPLSAAELRQLTGLSAPAISEHLGVLRRSGLVESQRAGRTIWSTRTPLGSDLLAPH